jgi:class 3 adenylate cyclase/tetratricopeptide (TPR) repeat protein
LVKACRWCGTDNQDAADVCDACGRTFAPTVGAELTSPPADYTPRHLAERILATRDALTGERKHVTILFCDVVGSTKLANELGPEEMHILLAELFELALEQVHRYEGTVNQFLGDGFMAIFGAPIAHQDHAALAGLAALGVRDAVATRRDRDAGSAWDRVQLRMGLNSGPVVVGAIGSDLRMDYTAIGDTTNVAARLESAAEPGEILVSESTARAAEGVLETMELDPLQVKGKEQPIARSRLVSAVEITTRPPRRRAEFVGRTAEIDALRATFDRVCGGSGAIVGVEGEPGVGKSRLLLEFIQGLGEDARVARGQCITYGNQIPNVPIAGLVRELCGVRADDEPSVAMARIEQTVGDDLGDVSFLAAVGGVPEALDLVREIDPATVRGRTAQSLRRLLGRRSQDRPLVAAIEDLHWADASSLDFLSEMAASVPERSILLLATYRPGSAPPWESGGDQERVALQPLGGLESESFVRHLPEAAHLTDEQVDRVLEKGEGNPFFLEELARTVVQGGGGDVPGDVLDVLAARIDRLPERMKALLQTASVIGREFEADVLRDAADAGSDLETQLIHLSDLGFIERVETSAGRWGFVHALTQDVAYGTMLKAVRQQLHLAVADVLIDRFAADPRQACEEIARHLVLSTDPDRAIHYLELANDKARTTHAMEEAKGFFEQALELLERREPTLDNIEQRVRLLVGEWTVFHFLHRHDEYAELIERYLPIVEAAGDPSIRGPYLAQRGHRLWVFTRYAEARAVLEEGLATCDQIGDEANAAHAEAMLQWLHVWTGEYEIADRYGRSGLERLESLDVPLLRTYTPVAMSLSHVFRGRWDEAAGWCDRAHDAGLETGDDGMASFGSAWGSFAELMRGDVETSLRLAQRSIDEAPTVYFRGWGQAFMAAAMCRTADVHPGIDILSEVAEFIRQSRHESGYLKVGLLLAEGWLYAGDLTRAREVAEELERWASSAGVPFVHAGSETLQGEVALAEGRHQEAADRFARAAERFEGIGAENGQAQAMSGLGRSFAAAGDSDAARDVLERSLATFERLGTLGEPDRVRAALSGL